MSLQNLKDLKKSDLYGKNELIKIFDFFNTAKAQNGEEEVLDKHELTSLFNTVQKAAQSSKGKDTSIFETEEAEEFISTIQTSEGKTLKELGVKATDLFEFLSKLIKPENVSKNFKVNLNLTEEQAQDEVIRILSDDAEEARALLWEQNNGVVTGLYDKYKEWRDDDLSLSNVEEAVVLQQEGLYNLQKAKEGTLSKKEYFLQNREHLKTMMKRRLFRKDENTGLDFLDRNRGKMTKNEFEKLMEEYINYQIENIRNLDSLKNVQQKLITLSDADAEMMLNNYKKGAKEVKHNPVAEQKFAKKEQYKIPQEYDTTEPMTFEEVFKFERNQEYSKEKVIEYMKLQEASLAFDVYDTTTRHYVSDYQKQDIANLGIDITKTDEECIQQIDEKQKSDYNMAFGYDYALDLVQSMERDNKDFMDTVDEITDGAQVAGLGCNVVGGILLFTPAAAVGAGLITLGNTLSLSGLAAENAVGYAEALTRQNVDPEEIEELNNSLLMDAGGCLIGAVAGKVGIKALNKLIDVKLAEVFKTQIAQGNRMEALKQVFTNPEHLKNFIQAAGVKLSADFLISYAGDLAMSEALGTNDDWMSLLKANLIGVAAGTSGDIKDVARLSINGNSRTKLQDSDVKNVIHETRPQGLETNMTTISTPTQPTKTFKFQTKSRDNVSTAKTKLSSKTDLQRDTQFIIIRRKFDSNQKLELQQCLQKYSEYKDKIIALLKNNERMQLNHIDHYVDLLDKNKDLQNEISYFFEIQRFHKKDLSDPFSETEPYLQLLKNQNTDKDFLLKLVRNPNIDMADINWILTTCREKPELKKTLQMLSGKRYSLDTIKSKLKAIDEYPSLSDVILEPNPRFKLIDKTPSKTTPDIIAKRRQLAELLQNNFINEYNNLKTTLGEDFFKNVKWEEIIPENASDNDIKSTLTTLNEKCKFFTRLGTNESRYGKDIQFGHAMYVSALSAAEKIKAGEDFNDVIQYIATDYHGYDERLYVNSFKTDKFDKDRLDDSGKYRGQDLGIKMTNFYYRLRGQEYNMIGFDPGTEFTKSGDYSEYYNKFITQVDKRIDKNLTRLMSFSSDEKGNKVYYMMHPNDSTVKPSMKKISKNFKSLQPLFKKVKKGNNLTDEEIKQAHDVIAEMYFQLANTMPFYRGSNGISDIFMRSCYKALDIDMPALKKNVSLDLEAFCTDMDEYKKNWLNFFEQQNPKTE